MVSSNISRNSPTAVYENAEGPLLRKSCQFCRSRKTRCSGHRVCTACRARKLNCVYEREALKGRPRGTNRTYSGKYSSQGSGHSTNKSMGTQQSDDSNDVHQPNRLKLPSPSRRIPLTGAPFTLGPGYVSTELVKALHRNFSGNRFIEASNCQVTYRGLFFDLARGLVEGFLNHYNSLGCCPQKQTSTAYIRNQFFRSGNSTVFGKPPTPPKKLSDMNEHCIQQLIEVWFSQHPLSFIISKTLLLNSYSQGLHDEQLLGLIVAEASVIIGDNSSIDIFEYARYQVLNRETGIIKTSISTVQSLILIGWHDLCQRQTRQGCCYLELASVGIIEWLCRVYESSPADKSWMNGIDIGKVELEIAERMYWLMFSLSLWQSLNLGLPFLMETMHGPEMITMPALHLSSSAVFSLDMESGNVASLDIQKKCMNELWLMSHIASMIAPLRALSLEQQVNLKTNSATPLESPRLKPPLNQPTGLADAFKIRDIWADGLTQLPSQVDDDSSQIFIISTYKTILIHLSFSRRNSGISLCSGLTESMLDEVLDIILSLKSDFGGLDREFNNRNVFMDYPDHRTARLLGLCLDTCARALHSLYNSTVDPESVEQEVVISRLVELKTLAEDLHMISSHPKLQFQAAQPKARETLEWLKEAFDQIKRLSEAIWSTSNVSSVESSVMGLVPATESLDTTNLPYVVSDSFNSTPESSTLSEINSHDCLEFCFLGDREQPSSALLDPSVGGVVYTEIPSFGNYFNYCNS
ncbi:hypothetical protein V8E54_003338 [Elaphomyces granulatus]